MIIIATISVPPVEPPCMNDTAIPTPQDAAPIATKRIRHESTPITILTMVSAGIKLTRLNITDIIKMQYKVLIPNFQPTIITPKIRRMQLITKIKLPMVTKLEINSEPGNTLERTALISVAKPAAPPPIPPAGSTHICQPKA